MKHELVAISSEAKDCADELKSSLFKVLREHQVIALAEQLQLGRSSALKRFRAKNSYKVLQKPCCFLSLPARLICRAFLSRSSRLNQM